MLDRVQLPSSSPASSLIFSPPTSHIPSASAPVPLAFGLPLRRTLLLRRYRASARFRATVGDCLRQAPRRPESPRGGVGSPSLLGRPLRARPGQTPRRVCPPLAHIRGMSTAAFRHRDTLSTRVDPNFEAVFPGSHVRAPTHQPHGYPQSSKAHYRPVGLNSGRVGFAPTRRLTDFL